MLRNASNPISWVERNAFKFFFFAVYWNAFQLLMIIVYMNALSVKIRIVEWERITFFTSEITEMEIHYFSK